ncbi:MAG: thioredoxin domain-containing protein [Planctomycetes bacterium]|nr:thioredoxin domain-containing protein [Planctomycetota bacterium]
MLNYAHAASSKGGVQPGVVAAPQVDSRVFLAGFLCLGIALAMTVMLIISHFDVMALPGCGQGGGCAEVTKGYWGKVPGTSFPVSFVGFAYFSGLLIAWGLSRGGVSAMLKNLVRAGVLFSLGFLVIMVVGGHLCWYCLITHVANIAFWSLVEFGKLPAAASLRPLGVVAGVFVLSSGALYAMNQSHMSDQIAKQNKLADESTKLISESSKNRANQPTTVTQVNPPADATTGNPQVQPELKPPPFTGRYRVGPEAAPVRILMITDYQCPDCRAVEAVAQRIIEQHKNVSLSIKNFPMDHNCNRNFKQGMHGNACWAARAAETAGILHGDDGFWQMHRWLFDRRGSFTDSELRTGLAELGFDANEFIQIMTSPQTEALVKADIEEAIDVGLFFTPMIFINGVHLRGVFEMNASKLSQSVDMLLSQNLPALTAEVDQRPTAVETILGDWKEERAKTIPIDPTPKVKGPADARVKIVVWGDYQEQWTAVVDRAIQKWMADKPDVSYDYRFFPFNQECNPVVSRTAFPNSCVAARAAEAAGMLGGIEGFWTMHDWLMANQSQVNEQTIPTAAAQMGLDAASFASTMASTEVAAAVQGDCKLANPMPGGSAPYLYRGSIPTVHINGKVVPRWRQQETVVIDKLLGEAYKGN